MIAWQPKRLSLLILAAGFMLTCLIFLPGLSGAWLVDDNANLGDFTQYQAGQAPYQALILGNQSGPLGRSVSMASFAANHALDLFSTLALKATNIFIHLCNGLLIYLLLLRLFRLKNPINNCPPAILSALITAWWLLLPIHISTVLYIVQRMTEVATFFSLATCICYVTGRQAIQSGRRHNGIAAITISLLVLFPLAVLAKESAFSTLAWLFLIELFFFNPPITRHLGLQPTLIGLIALVIIIGITLVVGLHINEAYKWRDFTLAERLLTESRILCSYIHDIFLPNSASMGVFQDDYPVSKGLLSPWTTLAALLSLCAMLFIAIRLADSRWWALSFGLLLYFSGHLIESTIVPLELYFEHRNYLPSIGLLIAASSLLINIWPWKRYLLAIIFLIYLGLLSASTLQRTYIWGNKSALLEVSALNHPHSIRAWTDYAEDLRLQGNGRAALEAVQHGADNNPTFAGIFYLQGITIYCRNNQAPPPLLIQRTADGLATGIGKTKSLMTPLQIGLEYTLSQQKQGLCGSADFSPLVPALINLDQEIVKNIGESRKSQWFLRLAIAEWLLNTGQPAPALTILRDAWSQDNKSDIPMVGLVLAQTLHKQHEAAELKKVLAELTLTTEDAPPDFQAELNTLRQHNPGPP